MPPAAGALLITIGSSIAAAMVKSAIVKALITIAATLAVKLLTKKPKTNKLNQGQELSVKFDPTMPRQVLTGHIATGGSCHFAHTTTNDAKKPNRYLYRVIQLSDQPCNALVKIMEGKDTLTFAGDVTTGWRACNQHLTKDGAACMWVRVHLGSFVATADTTLVSETGGVWTNGHKGTGLCYAIVKLDSDPDAFPSGEPELVFHMQGARLYDDRKDSTVSGGSGSHRLNLVSTWEYSDTASVITAQALRGFYINGVRILGVGADNRDLAPSMLFSAHNTCEELVGSTAGNIKRYAAATILAADEPANSYLEDLQAAMDGNIFDRGGSITILPGAIRTPVLNLTDQDIDWSEQKSWQPRASLEAMLNCVTANFVDAEQNFQEADLPVLKNATWEANDGGERFTSFFSFRALTVRSQGQRITKRIHAASRYQGTCAFVGGTWLIEMEQGDWFTLTSARWGFTTKYFEIQDITITKDLKVSVIGREVHPSIDGWSHSVDEVPRTDTTWNPPVYGLPLPEMYTTAFKVVNTATGIQTFNLDIGLIDPALYGAYVKYVEIEYRLLGASEAIAAAIFSVDQKKTTITGLAPGLNYEYRARTSDGYRGGAWTSWTTVATIGATKIDAAQLTYDDPVGGPGTAMDVLLGDTATTVKPGGGVADGQVQTGAIVSGAISVPATTSSADTFIADDASVIVLETGWLTIGDVVDGQALVLAFGELDSASNTDTAGRMHLEIDTGAGYVYAGTTAGGLRTNSGNTYVKTSLLASATIAGAATCRVRVTIESIAMPGASARSFYFRSPQVVILGAKR